MTLLDAQGAVALRALGVHARRAGASSLPPVARDARRRRRADEAGIVALDYHAPSLCVRATDVEHFHGSPGRYTVGRGQELVTFASDDEDAVSMALSALCRLLARSELAFEDIGRLECGTESGVDRGKSTKSFLMSLFEATGDLDVQGADAVNACYGGTNALLSTRNWIHGPEWTGRYGAVVCSDPAVHPDPAQLAGVGASAVSLLAGPRASLAMETRCTTFVKHAWDFYRPIGWSSNDALVDVAVATSQYEEAMLWCRGRFDRRDLLLVYDRVAYHCNAPYHAKRNFRVMCEAMHALSKGDHERLYDRHVLPGTAISAQNATTYTCPLYACLLSLVI